MIIRTTRTSTWVRVNFTGTHFPSYKFNNLEEAVERLDRGGVDIDIHHNESSHKIQKSTN